MPWGGAGQCFFFLLPAVVVVSGCPVTCSLTAVFSSILLSLRSRVRCEPACPVRRRQWWDRRLCHAIFPLVSDGDNGGAYAVPVFKHFQDISSLFIPQFCQPPVIYDQDGVFGQTGEKLAVTSISPGNVQFLEQSRQPNVMGAVPAPAGTVGQGAGDECLSASGRPGNDHVLLSLDPAVLHQGNNNLFGKPAWCEADRHDFADQRIGHAVEGTLHHNVIVDVDLGLLPFPEMESFGRQRFQCWFVDLLKELVA